MSAVPTPHEEQRRILPFEVDIYIPAEQVDAARDALIAAGPTGMGSQLHDRVPEDQRDLEWWCLEWGWATEWLRDGALRFRGIYGDWNDADDDVRFFTTIAPFVDPNSSTKFVVSRFRGEDADFHRDQVVEWRFGEGVARRWKLDRTVLYLETNEEYTDPDEVT